MDLLTFVKDHCKKYGITLVTTSEDSIPYPDSGLPCTGYFVVKNNHTRLGVAMGFSGWQETLLHEFCHSMQWIEKAPAWTQNHLTQDESKRLNIAMTQAEAMDVLDLWEQYKIELSPEDLRNFTNRAIEVERDCEQRTAAIGSDFIVGFDPKQYTKKANAYLRCYKYVERTRGWAMAGDPPYADNAVVAAQSDSFDQDYTAPLTDEEIKVFDTYASQPAKPTLQKHMADIRSRSGNVTIDCKLTSFLYTLMRDHVQPGDIEEIMLTHVNDEPVEYSNGWLAQYAQDIANRLKHNSLLETQNK